MSVPLPRERVTAGGLRMDRGQRGLRAARRYLYASGLGGTLPAALGSMASLQTL